MCSGYLPVGAEEHPFNPSNEVEVVEFIKCDVYDCYTEVENEGDVCPKCKAESEEIGMAEPRTTMNIYIASSWKNQHAVELLTARLREQGHTVISWIENNYGEDHGPDKPLDFEAWVKTPAAERSFVYDTTGAAQCDLFIYASPGGKDAAAECGIAYGAKTPMMWALWAKGEDFGLMRKMFHHWFTRAEDLLSASANLSLDVMGMAVPKSDHAE